VTGMQSSISSTISEMTGTIRQRTQLPIAIGFGISNPEQARQVAEYGDAIIVGSAVVNKIAEEGKSDKLVSHVSGFVGSLSNAIKSF
jgi:tryptophan synthase alpha chain